MNAVTTCPNSRSLQRFLQGALPEQEAGVLEKHLKSCKRCLEALAGIDGNDPFVNEVRVQATAKPNKSPVLHELTERMSRLPASILSLVETKGVPENELNITPSEVGAAEAEEREHDTIAYQKLLGPPKQPDEIGRIGSYRVMQVLGAGGMGMVFHAEDVYLKRPVALKAMRPEVAEKESARKRFLREAQAAAAIKHDHIVTIYQVGEDRKIPFLAMEFLDGQALDVRLKREKRLPIAEIIRIGREIAEGLSAAHKHGLIHRDIKPGNIWLEKRPPSRSGKPTPPRVKILDFGLARTATDDVHLTKTGTILGTPAYMAPEQARGGDVDHRVDLFSLGSLLYHLCTGSVPFKGETTLAVLTSLAMDTPSDVRQINPQAPPPLAQLISGLMAKKPADRPASADEVVLRLQALERGESDDENPTLMLSQPAPAPSSRLPLPLLAGLSGLAALVLVFLIPFTPQVGTEKKAGPGEKGPRGGMTEVVPKVPTDAMATVYPAFSLKNAQAEGGEFRAGQPMGITYELVNGGQADVKVPPDSNTSRKGYSIGICEHWIERLGSDAEIPAIPLSVGRKDKRYFLSRSVVWADAIVPKEYAYQFANPLDTAGFPAGTYRYWIEYKKHNGALLQTAKVDFDLMAAQTSDPESPFKKLIGQPAIPLEADAWVNGTPLSAEDLKGKVVLLDFWAVWCPPCRAAFPHLRDWQQKYSDQGLVQIGLTHYYSYGWDADRNIQVRQPGLTPAQERAAMMEFVKFHDLKHRIAFMPPSSDLALRYAVKGIPQMVLIDRKGTIRYIQSGYSTTAAAKMEEHIRELLAEPAE